MHQYIGLLAWFFVGMTALNRVLEGAFITADDVGIMNTLTLTRDIKIAWFTIPGINTDFFFVGIPRLVKWDYSFFGGNAAIFQYFLYSFTFALTFMLFILLVGLVAQYFLRR